MLHRYRIQPSSLTRVRFTGILASPAKNLAKSLDKGLAVEYGARVFILELCLRLCSSHYSYFSARFSRLDWINTAFVELPGSFSRETPTENVRGTRAQDPQHNPHTGAIHEEKRLFFI